MMDARLFSGRVSGGRDVEPCSPGSDAAGGKAPSVSGGITSGVAVDNDEVEGPSLCWEPPGPLYVSAVGRPRDGQDGKPKLTCSRTLVGCALAFPFSFPFFWLLFRDAVDVPSSTLSTVVD